jgi:hypothetical protein
MRYELADYEWIAIRRMLPNKPARSASATKAIEIERNRETDR